MCMRKFYFKTFIPIYIICTALNNKMMLKYVVKAQL